METNKDLIIAKLEELINNLTLQKVTPEPTTLESEGKYMSLLLKEDKLREELQQLKSQPESVVKEEDVNFILINAIRHLDSIQLSALAISIIERMTEDDRDTLIQSFASLSQDSLIIQKHEEIIESIVRIWLNECGFQKANTEPSPQFITIGMFPENWIKLRTIITSELSELQKAKIWKKLKKNGIWDKMESIWFEGEKIK
jgi:hypothetical protein